MFIKKFAYEVKIFIKSLFMYPTRNIILQNDFDYDAYWLDKRGKNIGELSSWQRLRAEYVLSCLTSASSSISVADVGCGDGSILNFLKKNEPRIKKMYGYDSSELALQRAREYGVETNCVNISDSNSYEKFVSADYYLLLETLEHVSHSEELLLAVFEKSLRGVFFSFPNTGYLTHRLRLLFGKFPLQWRIFPNEHVRFWTLADLRWWLRALNFTNYSIHYYKGIPYLNKIFPGFFAAGFIVHIKK